MNIVQILFPSSRLHFYGSIMSRKVEEGNFVSRLMKVFDWEEISPVIVADDMQQGGEYGIKSG